MRGCGALTPRRVCAGDNRKGPERTGEVAKEQKRKEISLFEIKGEGEIPDLTKGEGSREAIERRTHCTCEKGRTATAATLRDE